MPGDILSREDKIESMPTQPKYTTQSEKQKDDKNVFRAVFEQYYPALCLFAERLIKDRPAAEDLVEDVFVRVWQNNPEFTGYNNIAAILYTAVKNSCLNYLKAEKRQKIKHLELGYLFQGKTESFALREIVHAELLREMHAALQTLPSQCRTVMNLMFIEGWNANRIASYLNVTVSTIKTQKRRGIKMLKSKLSLRMLVFLFLMP